jgi:UDP-glucose 4-epimerase
VLWVAAFGPRAGVTLGIATLSTATGTTAHVEYHPGRAFDVPHMVLSIERVREVLDWTPSTPFEEGIAAHWRWLRGVHG